ncbi:MAG: ABC transporter permease, partial [Lachnospiraceae bacterium]|nr:ABC transporter permease [Lachnospiraceae bacterium]
QLEQIRDTGVVMEPHFSYDLTLEDGSVLRIFQNREQVDTVELDDGREAETVDEIVLEKRYCEEHGIHTGDLIRIASHEVKVTGIGSVVDYDAPLRKLSDSAVDSRIFGLGFMTAQGYELFREIGNAGSEDLTYAFILKDVMSSDDLKQMIRDFPFDYRSVDDPYYREMLDDTYGKKDEITDGINKLADGSLELYDGASELKDGSAELKDGMKELYEGTSELKDGTRELKEGMNTLLEGSGELCTGTGVLAESMGNYVPGLDSVYEGSVTLNNGIQAAENGAVQLDDGAKDLKKGVWEAYEGSAELDDGAESLYEGAGELRDGILELKEQSDEVLEKLFSKSPDNITAFLLKEDNLRIGGASGDIEINKTIGMVAGIIVIILFTYVLSVFVINQIREESSVIGALYALGVRKRDLVKHYIFLPTLISFLGGLTGAAVGLSGFGSSWQMSDSYAYYSIPVFDRIIPPYLLVYAILMPPLVSVLVNFLVINKSLSRTALSLIRNEQKVSRGKDIRLPDMPFMRKFTLRQMLRERRIAFTVMAGMFIALMIFMLGMDCYVLCKSVGELSSRDTGYRYMYTYKYPTKEVPEGGEACYVTSLKKTLYGYTLDVTVMGIDRDNPYFDVTPVKGKNRIVASDAVSARYNVGVGDQLVLTDNASDISYAFTVAEVVPYSVGLTVFMDIESMRELFGEDEDYYNVVLAGEELKIEEGRLYAVTTKEDIDRASGIFTELMAPMVTMLIVMSAIIFCIVMYLMTSVMIKRAEFGISLVKIFGFNGREVRKLYLDGNRLVVIVGALISIPAAKWIIDSLFPIFIANVACSMHLEYTWYHYVGLFAAIILIYSLISLVITRKINRVTPAEVLKNRE